MHQGCAQIDILTSRIQNFNNQKKQIAYSNDKNNEAENEFFNNSIKHHTLIYE